MGVINDSVRYPFSDWKKILLLGIFILLGNLGPVILFIGTFIGLKNLYLTLPISIIAYVLFGFIINGYKFKIIKTSLEGISELPDFNNWIEIVINGIKVSLVVIFYCIPTILILIYAAISFLPILVSHPSIDVHLILSILSGFILVLFALLYLIIIMPINYMAITHMVHNDGKLSMAFRFGEIFEKIGRIGWINLLVWYIVTGVISIVISVTGGVISTVFSILTPGVGLIINSLIVSPYNYMFLNRSIALCYMSENIK